jgi:hypothetical protein
MGNASNVASQIADDIAKDATNRLNRAVRHIATSAHKDWIAIGKSVMDQYYYDYAETTMRYNSTFSMYKDLIVPIFWKKNSNYNIGIRFYPTKMNHGTLPMFSEEAIYENFMSGAHGNTKYAGVENARKIFVTTPSAQSVLDDYYANYDKQIDKYFEEGKRYFNT